jgi:hypothetical protein
MDFSNEDFIVLLGPEPFSRTHLNPSCPGAAAKILKIVS